MENQRLMMQDGTAENRTQRKSRLNRDLEQMFAARGPETGTQPMKTKTTLLAVFFLLMVTVSLSQAPRPPVEAKPGDIATGVVESESGGRLYLNTTPCKPAQEADIVVFHQPYTRTPAGEIVCNGHHFDKVSVRQQ